MHNNPLSFYASFIVTRVELLCLLGKHKFIKNYKFLFDQMLHFMKKFHVIWFYLKRHCRINHVSSFYNSSLKLFIYKSDIFLILSSSLYERSSKTPTALKLPILAPLIPCKISSKTTHFSGATFIRFAAS